MSEPTAPDLDTTEALPGTPELPKAELHLCTPTSPGVGIVVASEICTASAKAAGFVRHIAIDISATPMAGRFRPGQSFGVLAPGLDAKGRPHGQRLYSLASPSGGEAVEGKAPGSVVATTVKRTIDEHWDDHRLFLGVCSNYLCDLKPGDEVRVTGPHGKRFLLPVDPTRHDYVFFATGTGIAPFRGMIRDLLVGPGGRGSAGGSRVVLVMGSPYSTDLLYDRELRELAAEHTSFEYVTAISRESGGRAYVQDRLVSHASTLGPLLASERTLVYLCGIAGMEVGVFSRMAETLPESTVGQYLRIDPSVRGAAWDRKMIGRQVKPTRRVFVEVY